MVLNRDILSQAFPEIMKEYIFDKNFQYKIGIKMKKLTTLMFSGKECFKIGLDFFAKSKYAEVNSDEIFIGIINSNGKLEKYIIYYNFPLIKPIMAAIGEGIEKLNIINLPSVIKAKNALDFLIRKKLNNVIISTNSSHNFIHRLNSLKCTLTVNIYERFYGSFPALIKFCENLEIHHRQLERFKTDQQINGIIYPKIKKLILVDFLGQLIFYENFYNLTFPSIQHLILKGSWWPSEFSIEGIQNHLKFVLSNFPNLKTLKFDCKIGKNNQYHRVNQTLFKFNPQTFKENLPSHFGNNFDGSNEDSNQLLDFLNSPGEDFNLFSFVESNEDQIDQSLSDGQDQNFVVINESAISSTETTK